MAKSLPLRKCGLKQETDYVAAKIAEVISLAEVWIETGSESRTYATGSSLPLRKCGLKLWCIWYAHRKCTSLPLRKCGLKRQPRIDRRDKRCHFPCGSVDWNNVEVQIDGNAELSLPLRKCGLKPCECPEQHPEAGHFPCGSVDWNTWNVWSRLNRYRHFPCGSVDWNDNIQNHCQERHKSLPLRKCGLKHIMMEQILLRLSHFPCGSVDWNLTIYITVKMSIVTSLAEVWIETPMNSFQCDQHKSLPLRKCGLKH